MHLRGRSRCGKTHFMWLVLCALAGGATGGYFGFYLPYQSREREAQRQIDTLKRVVERLTSERRIAEVVQVDARPDPTTGQVVRTLRFVEYDRTGQPMMPRYLRVVGDEVYFDALVIKFQDDFVAAGDALRGQSIYLFRRVFGDQQRPVDGEPIDEAAPSGGIPSVYRVDPQPNPYELDLWHRFWEYANDPEMAARQGVRVVQGEAAYMRILPGRIYTLTIEADGGINIAAKPVPPVLAAAP